MLASATLLATSATVARTQGPAPAPGGRNLQVVDTSFRPSIGIRTYKKGAGATVTIDEAHHNFHTIDGRYRPFANLLEADGFTVRPGRASLSAASLEETRILVIANSLEERNLGSPNWRLPSYSAFDSSEPLPLFRFAPRFAVQLRRSLCH